MSNTDIRHPRLRWLVDHRDGVLAGPRRDATESHLRSGCAPCEARLLRLERMLVAVAAGPLPAAPAREVRAGERLYASTHRAAGLALAAELDAVLVLDQGAALAASVRAAPGDVRRMLWTFGEWELDASLIARNGGVDVVAQVLGPEDDPDAVLAGKVTAWTAGRTVAESPLRADGRFTLRGLRPGVYALRGSVDGTRFRIPELVVDA